jgi:hypothetical protein
VIEWFAEKDIEEAGSEVDDSNDSAYLLIRTALIISSTSLSGSIQTYNCSCPE